MPDSALNGAGGEILPGRFGEQAGEPGVRLRRQEGMAMAGVARRHGQTGGLSAKLKEDFGIALPAGPSWSAAGKLTIIGIGPDRWLAYHEAPDEGFVAKLAKCLAGSAAVVDQSDSLLILDLDGTRVRDLLAKGLNIDLHPAAFSVDAAAVTTIAEIPITLWQTDPAPVYRIAVPRSWIGSFLHWLAIAAAEFGLLILPGADGMARCLRPAADGAANSDQSLG